MKQAVLFSLALILLSNGLTLFSYSAGIDRQLVYLPWACALLAMALGWGRTYGGLSWKDIGLSGGPWKTSLLVGIASGLALALPLVLFLAFPFLFARPVQYSEIESLDRFGLLWRLGVELTLATALTEEILFRGILQALFKRSSSTVQALVLTNVVFALWHLGINALSVQQNALVLPLLQPAAAQAIGYLGSLIAVGMGGLIFSLLRERTENLAGSITMHWVTAAAMTLLIYQR